MLRIVPFVLALLLLAAPAARAEFYTGTELLERLSDHRRNLAMGYVAGVFDTTWGRVQCAPPATTLDDVTDLVELALTNLPTLRKEPADVLVLALLQHAWPCPKRGKTTPMLL
jgi:hypothetical protein